MTCLFCNIVSKTNPAEIVYEDDQAIAFNDIAPKAPTHILIIPKKHLGSVEDIESSDEPLIGHLIYIAKQLAHDRAINKTGYRLVLNTKKHAGQIIDHLHLHLLGGTKLGPLA